MIDGEKALAEIRAINDERFLQVTVSLQFSVRRENIGALTMEETAHIAKLVCEAVQIQKSDDVRLVSNDLRIGRLLL